MTPHPGTPRGNALPVPPGPVQATRRVLAALVLAVLTLVGGAPAAGAALPVGALGSLASAVAYTPSIPAPAPRTDRTAHPGGPHHDLRRTRTAPSVPGPGGRNARGHQHPTVRTGPARPQTPKHPQPQSQKHHPQAQTLHERSLAAGEPTTRDPRAGIGRAHLTGHAPPPSYEGLLPSPAGPIRPYGRTTRSTVAASATPSGRRGAQPGVRGPPDSTTAGSPTGHRSSCSAGTGHPSRCSADPASRPR